ncbi:MAG: class I SAM-dependent methyltransferase [Steroidobacteraceae bacterium]
MERNIPYQTDQLARHFVHNRIAWGQFYESERVIIEGLHLDSSRTILDIGCGCGGLGLALRAQFGVESYTGVEINPLAADVGRKLYPAARILCGDILDLGQGELHEQRFDVVFSLSCVDWNVRFDETLAAAWSFVAPGGSLVATFRLTEGKGCNDITRSYQYINFEGKCEGERASYVVNGARDLMRKLKSFRPSEIAAFGYWGAPSATAITPYEQLCFAAFAIRKRVDSPGSCRIDLKLPESIRSCMES